MRDKLWNKFSVRERAFIFLTTGIILVYLLNSFFLQPLIRKWQELEQKVTQKEVELLKFRRALKVRKEVELSYEELNQALFSKKPSEVEISAILEMVDNLANQSGLQITDITPRPVEDKGLYKEYQLEISLQTTSLPLAKFLYSLGKNSLNIERLQIVSPPGSSFLKCSLLLSKLLM